MLFPAATLAVLGKFYSILPSRMGQFSKSLNSNITTVLGSQLSDDAQIYLPGSDQFPNATARWSAFKAPRFSVVVEVATDRDVAETVRYANKYNIPFMAVTGGHGTIVSLENLQSGVQIWLHKLNSISIADNGKTATIGGGALSKHVTESLWAKGKQTVTGHCECTSFLGPGLGGGHGILQGHYGLVADQFVSLDMVLGNGSLITIDDQSDLWWAVKGAGHNFGIVTSVTIKIYDAPNDDLWSYSRFVYSHDKVEAVYEAINTHVLNNGAQPVNLSHYSYFINIPALDPDHALFVLFLLQGGTDAVEYQYVYPFLNISSLLTESGKGSFKDIAQWTEMATSSPICQKTGKFYIRFPVDLHQYNPIAQRAVFDHFSTITHTNTALNGSACVFEGYSVHGVKSIPSNSTAFPHREANILAAPAAIYEAGDEGLEAEAFQFGDHLRDMLFQGSGQKEMYSYVNYAAGNEGPQSWYGHEPWRLEKLRALKAKYDPDERLNFYAPFT